MSKITFYKIKLVTRLLTLALLCVNFVSIAQNFTQNFNSFPPGSTNNTIDFADVDGDGDLDLFLTGQDNSSPYLADLYLNNGSGTFTFSATLPSGVRLGGAAFGDVDGDSDLDLVVLGRADGTSPLEDTSLYLNDGSGNYTISTNHSMTQLRSGDVAMADVDGDSDLDVLISGWDGGGRTIELHLNNGSGTFTLAAGTSFTAVTNCALRFGDIDGDSDLDLLIMGDIGGSDEISELYLNNGTGTFTVTTDGIVDVKTGDAEFADVDGDGDLDVLLAGINNGDSIGAITDLYLNDGSGNFTVNLTAGFTQMETGSIDFGDVDGDGDLDVLLTGKDLNGSNVAETLIYHNNGSGNFTLLTTPFNGVRSGDGKFGDIDGDGDLDVIYSGWDESGRILEIFNSDASTTFSIEDESLVSFRVFPNPSSDYIEIMNMNNRQIEKLELFNILGNKVLETKNKNQINISNLSNGIYILKISSEELSLTKRIIKN